VIKPGPGPAREVLVFKRRRRKAPGESSREADLGDPEERQEGHRRGRSGRGRPGIGRRPSCEPALVSSAALYERRSRSGASLRDVNQEAAGLLAPGIAPAARAGEGSASRAATRGHQLRRVEIDASAGARADWPRAQLAFGFHLRLRSPNASCAEDAEEGEAQARSRTTWPGRFVERFSLASTTFRCPRRGPTVRFIPSPAPHVAWTKPGLGRARTLRG